MATAMKIPKNTRIFFVNMSITLVFSPKITLYKFALRRARRMNEVEEIPGVFTPTIVAHRAESVYTATKIVFCLLSPGYAVFTAPIVAQSPSINIS